MEVGEVVEVAEEEGGVGGEAAAAVRTLVYVLDIYEVGGGVLALPPQSVHLVTRHWQTSGGLERSGTERDGVD